MTTIQPYFVTAPETTLGIAPTPSWVAQDSKPEVFFIVTRDANVLRATRRWKAFEDALIEARRLAKQEKARFFIFQLFTTVEPEL